MIEGAGAAIAGESGAALQRHKPEIRPQVVASGETGGSYEPARPLPQSEADAKPSEPPASLPDPQDEDRDGEDEEGNLE
jgi:hypothetical protein